MERHGQGGVCHQKGKLCDEVASSLPLGRLNVQEQGSCVLADCSILFCAGE